METLPITSTIAALLAIIMLPLTLQVSIRRAVLGRSAGDLARFSFGDGGDDMLRRRMRAFGNFIEYTPMCLIMLGLSEVGGASARFLWVMGALLLAGRCLHALGMLYSESPAPRGAAMMMTYAAFVVPALWLLKDAWT